MNHVDVVKVLIRNGADVNAVDKHEETALHFAIENYYKDIALNLLCFGADLDMVKSIHNFLRPITDRLNLLRAGKRVETSLMSKEESQFLWNLAFVLGKKYPGVAFKTYNKILSFITFHGIFMASGRSRWEKWDTEGRFIKVL